MAGAAAGRSWRPRRPGPIRVAPHRPESRAPAASIRASSHLVARVSFGLRDIRGGDAHGGAMGRAIPDDGDADILGQVQPSWRRWPRNLASSTPTKLIRRLALARAHSPKAPSTSPRPWSAAMGIKRKRIEGADIQIARAQTPEWRARRWRPALPPKSSRRRGNRNLFQSGTRDFVPNPRKRSARGMLAW